MQVTIFIMHDSYVSGNIDLNMVDVWYKENYWTTSSKALGVTNSGPFSYDKGHRKAILWDGAGTVILEINDFDFPPYQGVRSQVRGRAFYNVKGKPLRFGDHQWFQNNGKRED
jgi:hypothetical protein